MPQVPHMDEDKKLIRSIFFQTLEFYFVCENEHFVRGRHSNVNSLLHITEYSLGWTDQIHLAM